MDCFECSKAHHTVSAVGVCRHCGVGLCLDHLVEANEFRVGGTTFACPHALPRVARLRGVPAGIAAAAPPHPSGAR